MSVTDHLYDPAGNGLDTDAWRTRQHKLDTEKQIADLQKELAAHQPAPGYVRAMTAATITTAVDWALVAGHTAVHPSGALNAWLGGHQVVAAALSIVTACLWIGWAMWRDQCRREARRDQLAEKRHDLQMQEIRRLFKAMLREGDAETFAALTQTQGYLDSAGRVGTVMPFPQGRRAGS
ncbi:hypothetical protein [Micromonospora sediminicola]|uniref:hypothetical protein n=1 Tax=Micromonospora sediminicola TaxID=946078 RepID=UPI0037B6157C